MNKLLLTEKVFFIDAYSVLFPIFAFFDYDYMFSFMNE